MDGIEDLLRSWELPEEVILNFTNNKITPESLAELNDDLLKELCPIIGIRLKIKKIIAQRVTADASTSTVLSNQSFYDKDIEENFDELLNVLKARPQFPDFELKTLLTTSVCGSSVIKYYETYGTLSNKHRNHLVDIIVRHIFTRLVNHRITYEEYNILTSKIIALFPKETPGTYFVPPIRKRESISGKPVFAKGKLVDKIRNTLFKSGERKRNSSSTNINSTAKISKNIDSLKDSHIDEIIWLKNNSEPWSQVLEKWSNTYEVREAADHTTLTKFIEEWPILKDSRADVLINIDFEKKYPEKDTKFFQNWSLFFEKIKLIKSSSLKEDGATLLEFIQNQPDHDHKLPHEIKLLCLMVPPRGRYNRKQKISILECQESFIVKVQNPGHIQPKIEEISTRAAKTQRSVQPYIIHCSNEASGGTYYLVIDQVRYIFTSAYKAFDTLFKCYHTFHASYPVAGDHLYVVIQRCVYGIKTNYDKIVPYISDLIIDAKFE